MAPPYTDTYSDASFLPIPVIRGLCIKCQEYDWNKVIPEAVVDSGADYSLLPGQIVSEFIHDVRTYQVLLNGAPRTAVSLLVDIPGIRLANNRIFFVLWEEEEILIGRDIINQLRVYLNGALSNNPKDLNIMIEEIP